jgi:penicillin-insensitive murein endopeptidase
LRKVILRDNFFCLFLALIASICPIATKKILMRPYISILLTSILFACSAQDKTDLEIESTEVEEATVPSILDQYYTENVQDSLPTIVHGSVSNGSIENSSLLPFSGKNYRYFDTTSYLAGRGFSHRKVVGTLLATYADLETLLPERIFQVMECSNKNGGKLFPHRTHQNGLSVDLMMPKIKSGLPDYTLDNQGGLHYLLEFDTEGKFVEDESISLDFNTIALHILTLEKQAKMHGLHIEKVIINTHLKDELFASEYGKKLKNSGIYIVQNLSKVINDVHDDHFHVDFKLIK